MSEKEYSLQDLIASKQTLEIATHIIDAQEKKLRALMGEVEYQKFLAEVSNEAIDELFADGDEIDKEFRSFTLEHMDGILEGRVDVHDFIRAHEAREKREDKKASVSAADVIDFIDPEECVMYMYGAMEEKLEELMPREEYAEFMKRSSREAMRVQIIKKAEEGPGKDRVLKEFDEVMDSIDKRVKAPWE